MDQLPLSTPVTSDECTQQNEIRPRQTYVDGCPVLPKMQCHEVTAGQSARLQWQMKTNRGEFVRLADCSSIGTSSQSSSQSEQAFDGVGAVAAGVTLRMRELSGYDPNTDCVHTIDVTVDQPETGEVIADALPDAIVRRPGVYLEEWAVVNNQNQLLFSNQCVCFVRRGLFGLSADPSQNNFGPPTIEEIRLTLRDSSPADNLLLDNVEYDAAEISMAVLRPISYWNESPPPLRPAMTTCTFPFREIWLRGIQAYLFEIAANHYRRNHLPYQAGGVTVDDKNKEQSYANYSAFLLKDFREQIALKKLEINTALFSGSFGSQYSRLFY